MIKRARVAAVIVEHDQRTIARFVRPGATLVSIDDIPECPFSLVDHDYVLHAEVNDSATAGAVLLAVTRGIDVVVAVESRTSESNELQVSTRRRGLPPRRGIRKAGPLCRL